LTINDFLKQTTKKEESSTDRVKLICLEGIDVHVKDKLCVIYGYQDSGE